MLLRGYGQYMVNQKTASDQSYRALLFCGHAYAHAHADPCLFCAHDHDAPHVRVCDDAYLHALHVHVPPCVHEHARDLPHVRDSHDHGRLKPIGRH